MFFEELYFFFSFQYHNVTFIRFCCVHRKAKIKHLFFLNGSAIRLNKVETSIALNFFIRIPKFQQASKFLSKQKFWALYKSSIIFLYLPENALVFLRMGMYKRGTKYFCMIFFENDFNKFFEHIS